MTQVALDAVRKATAAPRETPRLIGKGLWSEVYDLSDGTVLKLVQREAGIGDGAVLWRRECGALLEIDDLDLVLATPELIDSDLFQSVSQAEADGYAAWLRMSRLEGKPLDDNVIEALPDEQRDLLATELAGALASLHRSSIAFTTGPRDDDRKDLDLIAEVAADAAPAGLIDRLHDALSDALVPSHGDINSTNLLVDDLGRLSGLTDFAEARRGWREGDLCHLALMPAFFPAFRHAFEKAAGVRLNDERLALATWHNVLISLCIARRTGDADEEAWALKRGPRPVIALRVSGSRIQAVAAGFCEQKPGVRRIVLDLLAQAVDVGFQGVGRDTGVVAPDLIKQDIAADRLVAHAIQELENQSFLFRETDPLGRLVMDQKLGGGTERVGADVENSVLALFVLAQLGADTGEQNSQTEWLGDVVVGA